MLNFRIAIRFLVKKPIQTLITLLVILIGTAIFYFILNAGASIKNLVLSTTAEANSHIYVTGEINFAGYDDPDTIHFRNQIFNRDSRISDLAYSYTLFGVTNIFQSNTPYHISIKGIDFEMSEHIQQIGRRAIQYKENKIPENIEHSGYFGELLVGNGFTSKLGFIDPIDVLDTFIEVIINNTSYKFKIVGVFTSDQFELSSKTIFTTIETTQKITNLKHANAIELRVHGPLDSDAVLSNIQDLIIDKYPNVSITQWKEGNRIAVNALYIEDVSIFVIQVFTAISISFGVTSLILFNIREKIKQIGILKALGINNTDARSIFSYQVIVLSIIGIIFGLFAGDFLAYIFTTLFRRPNSGVPLVQLYRGITNIYALITAIIMFVGCLISTLPAIKQAEKLKIIEVIKND